MKNNIFTIVAVAFLAAAVASQAQEMPGFPKPTKEHEWLQQLVGEWESESEMIPAPGQPSIKSKGTERTRSLGGFWVITDSDSTIMDLPFKGVMTLGYDTDKRKYVGTWIDSATGYLWHYLGTVDPSGNTLTLETQGPCHFKGGQLAKFREVIELKDKDNKVFTSSFEADDGQWQTMVTVKSRRKT